MKPILQPIKAKIPMGTRVYHVTKKAYGITVSEPWTEEAYSPDYLYEVEHSGWSWIIPSQYLRLVNKRGKKRQ